MIMNHITIRCKTIVVSRIYGKMRQIIKHYSENTISRISLTEINKRALI